MQIKKNPNIGRTHYVNVHNSQQFVEKYRNGTEWAESSGSSDIDTDDDDGDNVVEMSVMEGATSKRRLTKAPERYECATHPSFFRGKFREDQKRLNGNSKKWYSAMDSEQKKNYNSRKKHLWARNQRT